MTFASFNLDFHSTVLSVQSPQPDWSDRIRTVFPVFVRDFDAAAAHFALALLETASPGGHGLPLSYAGKMSDGQQAQIYQDDDRTVIELDGGTSVDINHKDRLATAFLAEGSARRFFGTALMTVVDAALSAEGRQCVHSASLMIPGTDKAVLMCVPSGGGKTTTALALARGGFNLITDDASVLVKDSCRFRVWGMPRALKVHRNTAKLLPWLGLPDENWDMNGEKPVEMDVLKGKVGVSADAVCDLGAIILIGPRSPQGHVIAKTGKAEVLVALAHDNVGWRAAGMTPKAMQSYAVFAAAVKSVPVLRLSAGTDLAALPVLVKQALTQAMADAS
jgi:hypothetical protein